jgi:hypothetical protein
MRCALASIPLCRRVKPTAVRASGFGLGNHTTDATSAETLAEVLAALLLLYSPKCVEEEFYEVRVEGDLERSPSRPHPRPAAHKASRARPKWRAKL